LTLSDAVQGVLHTGDSDFARFQGLRWFKPIALEGPVTPESGRWQWLLGVYTNWAQPPA
jgi:hypothetical protein